MDALMLWVVSLLCMASLLQPASCRSVRIDPSILEQTWSALEAQSSYAASCVGVEYSLTGQGYHRTLLTRVWREEEAKKDEEEEEEGNGGERECKEAMRQDKTVIIAVNVTSNVYIDLDQISQLAQFGGPKVMASGHIDTERSAMEAGHHLLLVFAELKDGRAEVEVPLHFRYLATGSSPYSIVTIPTPLLLFPSSKDHHTVTLPCSTTSSSHCHWHHAPVTHHHPNPPLQATVPLGQREHVTAVAIVTVMLTLASMLYLMHTFHSSQL